MSFIRGVVTTLDSLTLNLGPSALELKTALMHGDKVGVLQSSVEHAHGYVDGTRYAATGVDKGTTLAILAAKYFPITLDSSTIRFLEGITAAQVLAGLGIILASFTIIINSISISRQHEVLSVIPERVDRSNIQGTLESLDKINFNHFRKALPEHLKQRHTELGGINALKDLNAADDQKTDTAIKFANDVRDYARKKQIVHILGVIAGVVSLVASIGLVVGFPPLALMVLAIAGLALTIAIVMMNKGWVENPEDGFNWKLCLPEFIRKKLSEEQEKDIEMGAIMQVHNGYTQPTIYVSTVDEHDAALMTETFKEPEPQKQTLFEKFLGFFKRKPPTPIEMEMSDDLSVNLATQGVLRHGAHGLNELSSSSPVSAG